MKLLFLNGFDRCGSSMVGGLLAKHPQVAYFFQPFNRTEVHETQHELWSPGERHSKAEGFLQGLLEGELDRDFLGADLLDKFSTAEAPRPGALNVIKETKLHFKSAWLQERFPGIAVRGIWRDPRGILCSLLRNGFGARWYGDAAFQAIAKTIRRTPALAGYTRFLERPLADDERLALVVAARTHVFCESVARDEWVIYEDVLDDPDAALGGLLEAFGLLPFSFAEHLDQDYNVVGKPSVGADLWRTYFPPSKSARLDAIFGGLDAVGPPTNRARASR